MIFIRHGRAEDPSSEFTDFDRSLTTKGKIIARSMARELMEKENSLGLIITSPAFRALETAFIFAGEFEINTDKIVTDRNLYYKMSFQYLNEILSTANNGTDLITFFGHNPSFTEIPSELCKDRCDFMPKCGVAAITFNVKTWQDIRRNSGKLEYFLKPEKTV